MCVARHRHRHRRRRSGAPIFDAFQQASHGPEPKPEGTGLGLTLSRQIVGLHGGRIWLESELGAGKQLHVLAADGAGPRSADAGATGERQERFVPCEHFARRGRRALDRPPVALRRRGGFDIAVARDGEEGLELARQLRPRGIILDIRLPGLDGWEFLARAKADPDARGRAGGHRLDGRRAEQGTRRSERRITSSSRSRGRIFSGR